MRIYCNNELSGTFDMKITRRQLRKIIKESMALFEGVLLVTRGPYGITVDEDGEFRTVGEMVLALIESGEDDIFQAPQGVDPESLALLNRRHAEGVQGGMQRWDPDVFEDYYNVDNERVLRLYAKMKNHRIEEVQEEDEDDGTNAFEEYYS